MYILSYNSFINEVFNERSKKVVNLLERIFTASCEIEIKCKVIYDDFFKDDLIDYRNYIEFFKNYFIASFPKFYSLYADYLFFVPDVTIPNGIEIILNSKFPYFESLNELKDYINVFLKDFNNQNLFYFDNDCGFHINIGINKKYFYQNIDFNVLKIILMLDKYENKKLFNIYDEIEFRELNEYTEDNIKFVINRIKKLYNDKILDKHFESFLLNKKYLISDKEDDYFYSLFKLFKKLTINFKHLLEKEYIEFRLIGGDISKINSLYDKIDSFANLVLLGFDKNYKQKQYNRKRILFYENLHNTLFK